MPASLAQFAGAWQRIGDLAEAFVAALPNLAIALVVAVVFRVFAGWAGRAAVRFTDPHDRARAAGWVVGRLAEWAILSIGLLTAVSVVFPSFTAGDLIQVLGIGTVAVGFALKEILQNLFAGVLLLIGAPFRVGDEIAAVGHEGTVEDIQVRATLIRTADGRRMLIPNFQLFTQAVVVNTALGGRRSQTDVPVEPGRGLDGLRQRLAEAVAKVPGVLADPPPAAEVVAAGAGGATLRVFWWTDPRHDRVSAAADRVLPVVRDAAAAS